jgi:dCMP deaminase
MNDLDYIKEAYLIAKDFSTDPSTQNGAILVDKDGPIVALGANHFPQGVKDIPERWVRPLKYSYVEHAERNAIYDAAKNGTATKGLVMYCPWFACTDCARAIIQAGITKVVGHDTPIHGEGSKSWQDSIKIANTMLDEAGIEYYNVKGTVGLEIRFNEAVVGV